MSDRLEFVRSIRSMLARQLCEGELSREGWIEAREAFEDVDREYQQLIEETAQ